jgi:thiamine biosynthesis lipoprotein
MILPVETYLVVLLALVAGCGGQANPLPSPPATRPATQPALTRFEYAQIHMGMRTRLVAYASDENAAVNACRAAFARIAQIDDVASDYRKDSELNRFCATAHDAPVKLSDDLYAMLAQAQQIAELTGGAFDATCGPYVKLWRKARKARVLPSAEGLRAAGELVGYRMLHIDPAARTGRLDKPGMQLDLGGLAKGYAGDCAIATLREHGITSALFEAGGDIVCSGPPADRPAGWAIELVDAGEGNPEVVTVRDCAVSTSGDTMQFVEIGGRHYSHVVDPRTGVGLTSRAMATVIAPKGLWADPLSKPATMLSADELKRLLARFPGTRAYTRVIKGAPVEGAGPR